MTYVPTENEITNASTLARMLATLALLARALSAWRRAAHTRKALAELSPDQLRDIGQAENARPVLTVKPGLMANLMSLR